MASRSKTRHKGQHGNIRNKRGTGYRVGAGQALPGNKGAVLPGKDAPTRERFVLPPLPPNIKAPAAHTTGGLFFRRQSLYSENIRSDHDAYRHQKRRNQHSDDIHAEGRNKLGHVIVILDRAQHRLEP